MIVRKDKCVYVHKVRTTGIIFYVGMGNIDRAYRETGRNTFWNSVTDKHNYDVEIIAEDMTVEDAANLERYLINEIGREDTQRGTLVNLSDGGEKGSNGWILTPEKSARLKAGKVGMKMPPFTEEHKAKLALSRVGMKLSEEHKEAISKAGKGRKGTNNKKVIDKATGKVYESITAASVDYKYSKGSLKCQLNGADKRQPYNTFYYYD